MYDCFIAVFIFGNISVITRKSAWLKKIGLLIQNVFPVLSVTFVQRIFSCDKQSVTVQTRAKRLQVSVTSNRVYRNLKYIDMLR